ncbi:MULTISPECIES: hypothetical protein [unclassified Paenibacillus]|uniref:hypothetical protein n=1 Tax=unclassified Paenibacillus TaxID=185978 RepID=UPI0024055304|nr:MULTISPECIES: hypothetical protein [unclassified Paenibacillus]MDF9841546.1 hypothetical protein [Paenibacillus sp. PastF-2]MDF9848342.1 hypothetical protein [Paenibacillus sp. PastM-2]MDF9854704.1 hypothetical protein [Paenibacillus sp. PastF-1]MDH6479975.1 hypothetical protein [Paenibacillus sp. PastH-2]MDH6507409.1 hypothetical protein [Paenibacillus sp. PastM-3]
MTYSQRSARTGASSDFTYLEYQISIAQDALAQAEQAGDVELAAAIRKKLAGLEDELEQLED